MTHSNTLRLLTVASLNILLMQPVLGQGVGNPGSLPTSFELSPPPSTGWVVVDPNGLPIPVELDPAGPVWQKDFTGPGGSNVQASPGQTFSVQESLIVSGNTPWTDWHEDILNPDWSWSNPAIFVNNQPASGLVINNLPGNSLQGGSLSFLFNSVAPGSLVQIRKDLVYNGQPGVIFDGILHINQYPTPEPTMLSTLAIGGMILLRRRRRTRGSSR